MKRASLLALVILASPASVEPAPKWPDCFCTDRTGTRVELGDMICMEVDGRQFMAQCQMSLNSPMWREVASSCLSALLQLGKPPVDTRAIDPAVAAAKS